MRHSEGKGGRKGGWEEAREGGRESFYLLDEVHLLLEPVEASLVVYACICVCERDIVCLSYWV